MAFIVNYLQMRMMGGIGQRMLFSLRNAVFNKLQELPVDFFNQNKAGDLISRINNDTDKVNQFFSQSLMQFIGSIFTMTGAGIYPVVHKSAIGSGCPVSGSYSLDLYKNYFTMGKKPECSKHEKYRWLKR